MQRVGPILSLFAAEEIPAAMITFVSLLLFWQTGIDVSLSVCYSALLFLPWILKSFLREKVRRRGHFRKALQWSELLLVVCLLLAAVTLNPGSLLFQYLGLVSGKGYGLFLLLFLVSLLTAWHELAARMYYERMLRPRLQRFYNGPKIFVSQLMVVATYGLLIIFVGTCEVLLRSIYTAWSWGLSLTALVLSLFFLFHLFTLHPTPVGEATRRSSVLQAVKAEIHIIERIRRRPSWLGTLLLLFIFLLPQSLMFYTRVLFFMVAETEGGLGRSLQDVGFAQGVVGVTAFCLGISLGRRLLGIGTVRVRSSLKPLFFFVLTLSPFVYLVLSHGTGWTLWHLCAATCIAQFCFGFGLNACHFHVREISGERYRNTINYLYVPMVAMVMLFPMMLSGWLAARVGFRQFFLLDAFSALWAWSLLAVLYQRKRVKHALPHSGSTP